jgi:hypothetical protein
VHIVVLIVLFCALQQLPKQCSESAAQLASSMKVTQSEANVTLNVAQVSCSKHEPAPLKRSDELTFCFTDVDQAASQCQRAAGATLEHSSDPPSPSSSPTVASKRARAPLSTHASPLLCEQLLDTVFSYVGPGEYFYAAGVCKLWRQRYAQLCFAHTQHAPHYLRTSCRNALRTAERLALALQCGNGRLTVPALQGHSLLAKDIVQCSVEPQAVLTLTAQHGLAWTSDLCLYAVYANKLSLLQWLRERNCPWDATAVAACAARSAPVEVLQYLQSATAATAERWSAAQLTDLLRQAGTWNNSLTVVQWLRGQGAMWPRCFRGSALCGRVDTFHCAPRVTDWILANGCEWGQDWCCGALQAANEQYQSERVRQRAVQLFKLAHEHGCPCTCGTPAPLEKKRL